MLGVSVGKTDHCWIYEHVEGEIEHSLSYFLGNIEIQSFRLKSDCSVGRMSVWFNKWMKVVS